jgi:dUTP pyrophosphatase
MTTRRIKLKVKRLSGSEDMALPEYETESASGLDLRAAVKEELAVHPGEIKLVPTGIAVSIPQGYEGQVRPRSGLALRYGIGMVNSPGTIDSDYRGEIGLIVINWGREPFLIKRGDRIAQMVITPVSKAEVIEVDDLESTSRGEGGFGHSGI